MACTRCTEYTDIHGTHSFDRGRWIDDRADGPRMGEYAVDGPYRPTGNPPIGDACS